MSNSNQSPPYKAIQIANEFIKLGKKDGICDLSNLKLQKLVFFAHSIMLCDCNRPLIEESFYAWKLGPVVYELYAAIREYCSQRGWEKNHPLVECILGEKESISDQNALNAISDTWEVCKNSRASDLVRMTHLYGSPWSTVYETQGEHAIIPNEQIRDYMRRSSKKQVA